MDGIVIPIFLAARRGGTMFGLIVFGAFYIVLSLFAFWAVVFSDSRFVAFVDRLGELKSPRTPAMQAYSRRMNLGVAISNAIFGIGVLIPGSVILPQAIAHTISLTQTFIAIAIFGCICILPTFLARRTRPR